jgi:hypothetical protein
LRSGALALAALATVVLAACGSASTSGSTSAAGGGTATSTTQTASETETPLAQRMLPLLADFPSGWRAQANTAKGSPCLKDALKGVAYTGRAASRDFVHNQDSSSGSAYVLRDEPAARDLAARFGSDTMRECMARALDRALKDDRASGVKVGEILSGELSWPTAATESQASEIEIPLEVTQDGLTLTPSAYVDWIVMREGRAVLIFTTYTFLSAPDHDIFDPVLSAFVGRTSSVLGLPGPSETTTPAPSQTTTPAPPQSGTWTSAD